MVSNAVISTLWYSLNCYLHNISTCAEASANPLASGIHLSHDVGARARSQVPRPGTQPLREASVAGQERPPVAGPGRVPLEPAAEGGTLFRRLHDLGGQAQYPLARPAVLLLLAPRDVDFDVILANLGEIALDESSLQEQEMLIRFGEHSEVEWRFLILLINSIGMTSLRSFEIGMANLAHRRRRRLGETQHQLRRPGRNAAVHRAEAHGR